MKLIIAGVILIIFVVLYFFAKDKVIEVFKKARDGLAVVGAGTLIYWIYLMLPKDNGRV